MRLLFLDNAARRRRRVLSVASSLAALIGIVGFVAAMFFVIGYLVSP